MARNSAVLGTAIHSLVFSVLGVLPCAWREIQGVATTIVAIFWRVLFDSFFYDTGVQIP